MSLAVVADFEGLDRLVRRMDRIRHMDTSELLDGVGSAVESQVRRRIQEDQSGPDGVDWPSWSVAYAQTRHGGHSLLRSSGGLVDSIQYVVDGDRVAIGSNLVYAAIHQFGGAEAGKAEIPARPYLGLSASDLTQLEDIIDDWAQRQMEGLA